MEDEFSEQRIAALLCPFSVVYWTLYVACFVIRGRVRLSLGNFVAYFSENGKGLSDSRCEGVSWGTKVVDDVFY